MFVTAITAFTCWIVATSFAAYVTLSVMRWARESAQVGEVA